MNLKKSHYIRKYDYLGSLNRPKDFWFLSNNQINEYINFSLKNVNENFFDDEFEYNSSKYGSDNEFDSYEFYREDNNQLINLSDFDPKIIEGKIIDQKAKDFLIKQYSSLNQNFAFFDFDKFKSKSLTELYEKTQKILSENDYVILFQPVFLTSELVAKPDALVKMHNEYFLIEVKGTTSTKRQHILDILYQAKVIKNSSLSINIDNYYLCVIAYKIGKKNEVDFILTETFCSQKEFSPKKFIVDLQLKNGIWDKNVIKLKQLSKIGKDLNEKKIFRIKDYVTNNLDLENKKNVENWEIIYRDYIFNNFENQINLLKQHELPKDLFSIKCKPEWIYKNYFKDFDFLNEFKKIFVLNGYPQFSFSGKLITWAGVLLLCMDNISFLEGARKCLDNKLFFKEKIKSKKISESLYTGISSCGHSSLSFYLSSYDVIANTSKNIYVNKKNFINLWNKIKLKKIYFDFESICSAIRPIDNVLPFSQIITQCSIIKDDGDEQLSSVNLITDPKNINENFFKSIVDSLYQGKETDSYSYVVYNKSFEKTRLLEVKYLLQDKEYADKIDLIIKNIFDLADFFDLSKRVICMLNLKGFYSIKKVLPEILNDFIQQKSKVLKYTDLEVRKGDQCQSITSQRFFDKISDNEWKKYEKSLKKYCENDVRAMVAIYIFLKEQKNFF